MEEPLPIHSSAGSSLQKLPPAQLKPMDDSPDETHTKNPEAKSSSPSTAPRADISPLIGIEGYVSSPSSTPRDESSSGSPSPVPDDFAGENGLQQKPKVNLGKDLSLMMQALNSLQSPEEKIAALCKKYADLLEKQKQTQKQLRLSQKKQAQCTKEKDQLQKDHNRSVLAKGKIENLARELQKRNKSLQEEQAKKSMEEVNLRQEMASKFQTTLTHIESQMKTAVEGSNKLQSENDRMGGKLNDIVKKYQAREAAMENLVKQYDLQEKLLTAQLEKALLEHEAQRESEQEDKKKLLEQMMIRNKQYEEKLMQEKELRSQLQYYSEKFEDFKSTLEKSNDIFTSYRAEIDKMGKKLKQAEKERVKLTKKWEDATRAAADTMEYTLQLEAKQARLEKLSRALQAERNELTQRLRQYEPSPKTNNLTKPKKKNEETSEKSKNNENTNSKTTDAGEPDETVTKDVSSPVPNPDEAKNIDAEKTVMTSEPPDVIGESSANGSSAASSLTAESTSQSTCDAESQVAGEPPHHGGISEATAAPPSKDRSVEVVEVEGKTAVSSTDAGHPADEPSSVYHPSDEVGVPVAAVDGGGTVSEENDGEVLRDESNCGALRQDPSNQHGSVADAADADDQTTTSCPKSVDQVRESSPDAEPAISDVTNRDDSGLADSYLSQAEEK